MLLLISDANILIDIEVGELLAPMCSLNFRFAIPDILFIEELEEQHHHLISMGLQQCSLTGEQVSQVMNLSQQYRKTSRNDLFALVLAEYKKCPLLTGDKALREAAKRRVLK